MLLSQCLQGIAAENECLDMCFIVEQEVIDCRQTGCMVAKAFRGNSKPHTDAIVSGAVRIGCFEEIKGLLPVLLLKRLKASFDRFVLCLILHRSSLQGKLTQANMKPDALNGRQKRRDDFLTVGLFEIDGELGAFGGDHFSVAELVMEHTLAFAETATAFAAASRRCAR